MKQLDRTTTVRAHTPPPEPDGIALACALKTACYLAGERQVSRIRIGGYNFTVVGEAHVAYWDIREQRASYPNIWEFGLTPVFRFVKSSGWFRPYMEAGVGVRLLSHVDETPDRSFSSSFQFADMVGVGAQFGAHQNSQAGFRFQHLSNAGIKHPNPGIHFSEIYVPYNF